MILWNGQSYFEEVSRRNGILFSYIKEIKEIDDVVLVRLKGNIDAYTIPMISSDRTKPPNRHFLLDFNDVVHIDSTTLASILILFSLLKMKGRKLGVINPTPLMKNYLKVNKLTKLVKIYNNERKAVNDLRDIS